MPTIPEIALITIALVSLCDIGFAVITGITLVAYMLWSLRITEWHTRYNTAR